MNDIFGTTSPIEIIMNGTTVVLAQPAIEQLMTAVGAILLILGLGFYILGRLYPNMRDESSM